MAKESPRRRSAREKREAERETAPTAPAEPPTGDPPEETPTGDGASGVDLRRWALPAAAVVAIGVVAAVIIAIVAGNGGSTEVRTVTEKEPVAKLSTLDVPGGDQPSGTQIERSAATAYLLGQGYKLGQFSFKVVKPVYTERGAASVSEKPLLTESELKEWIQGGSDRSKAYLKYAKENLPDVDYERIRRGEGFVRVQLLVPSEYTKNSFFQNGKVVGTTERRSVETGDIIFLYVSKPVKKKQPNGREEESSEVREMGSTRGPCGNGGAVPVPVTGKPAPPITVPPSGGEEAPGPSPEPGPEPVTPEGGEEAPGTETTRTPPPPPQEKPKTDTPSNDKGPSGTGKYQPPSETEPPSEPSSPSSNGPPPAGTTSPHPPPPPGTSPPPGGQAPPAENGGETGNPAGDY